MHPATEGAASDNVKIRVTKKELEPLLTKIIKKREASSKKQQKQRVFNLF